jgi:hypothetical protein
MPRHPPCALHSLSHKHNTTTLQRLDSRNTPPTPKSRRHITQRCSRPLCRSQTTNPPTPTHTTNRVSRRRRPKKTQTNRPDPSGPNSVPTPPPTATAPGSTPTPEHQPLTGPAPRRAVLRHDHHQRRSFIDDSTSEHHQCQPDGCWSCGVCAP